MNNRWRRVKRLKELEARSMRCNSSEPSVHRTRRVIKAMGDAADEARIKESFDRLGEALRLQVEAELAAKEKAAEEGTFGHQAHRLKEALKGLLPWAIAKHFK